MRYYIGVDIGGTKCAATLGAEEDGILSILEKSSFLTFPDPYGVLERFEEEIQKILQRRELTCEAISALGISCGGPLDAERGIVQSPPNLPNWDQIPVTDFFRKRLGIRSYLENDANACAVAEWKYGAGKGLKNVIFLTFGTGLGAGLILDNRLYGGTNGNAGEIGHVRLRFQGPVGYGKAGSAEGFCSGGGLALQGKQAALEYPDEAEALIAFSGGVEQITAKSIAQMADRGDVLCKRIYSECGKMLGETLSVLMDVLNPQAIILGGVFMRSHHLLQEEMYRVIEAEALTVSAQACQILPSALGEQIGDYAALSLAAYHAG